MDWNIQPAAFVNWSAALDNYVLSRHHRNSVMEKLIAEEIATRLRRWNTVCLIAEQPEFCTWLTSRFSTWDFARDFSRLRVETIDPTGHNMLFKGEMDCLCWYTPEGVMDTPREFADDGLLMIGGSPCGDMLVIDTLASAELVIGFVSHEKVWGEECSPRVAYDPWPHPLLAFLDRGWDDPALMYRP